MNFFLIYLNLSCDLCLNNLGNYLLYSCNSALKKLLCNIVTIILIVSKYHVSFFYSAVFELNVFFWDIDMIALQTG